MLGMHLPVQAPENMGAEVFLDLMARDKKVVDGRLRLILLKAIGDARIIDDVSEAELVDLLQGPGRQGA